MSDQSGALAAGSARWATGHPGFAALAAAFLGYAGLAGVLVGLVLRPDVAQHGMIAVLWNTLLLVGGAVLFVLALPASLGFAGASCATQCELWPGVTGGFFATMLALVVVAAVLPLQGLA